MFRCCILLICSWYKSDFECFYWPYQPSSSLTLLWNNMLIKITYHDSYSNQLYWLLMLSLDVNGFWFFSCYFMNVRLMFRYYNHGMLLGYEFGKLNHLHFFFSSHFVKAFLYFKSFVGELWNILGIAFRIQKVNCWVIWSFLFLDWYFCEGNAFQEWTRWWALMLGECMWWTLLQLLGHPN